MTSPEDLPTMRERMDFALLSLSSQMYAEVPMFFARVNVAVAAANRATMITMGRPMSRDEYAIATQCAAVAALLGASVTDEEMSEAVDHEKVFLGMTEFSIAQAKASGELEDES